MWDWLMGQIGRSGDTLVDIVADIFTGVSSALQTIKDNVGEFVDGVKDGAEYILKTLMNSILDGFEYVTDNFIYSIGKILAFIIPGFNVVNSDFIFYENNGESIPFGFRNDNLDLLFNLGFLNISITDLFDNNPTTKINNIDLNHQVGGQPQKPRIIDKILPPSHPFFRIAWQYVVMEIIKEIVLTLSYTIWQMILVVAKSPAMKAVAMATHIGLNVMSYLSSEYIFNLIKSDASLSEDEQIATIFQIFNLHLDMTMGGLMDLILEFINQWKYDGKKDGTGLGFAIDATILNGIQGLISQPLFEKWNPTVTGTWSTISDPFIFAFEGLLLALGGGQMNYLFDSGINIAKSMVKAIKEFQSPLQMIGIINGIQYIIKEMMVPKFVPVPVFDFGYIKFVYGLITVGYHWALINMWGHSPGRL